MVEVAAKKRRIVHIAKELNISHRDIIELLRKHGIEANSHMSPVDEQGYQLIIEEFEKDRRTVERYRKEQVRKEIHSRKLEERIQESRTLEIMMPDEQRKLEEEEKRAAEEREKALKLEREARLAEDKKDGAKQAQVEAEAEPTPSEAVEETEEEVAKPGKPRFRKIELSDIEAQIASTRRKPSRRAAEKGREEEKPEKISIDSTIRKTLAELETKAKKKRYRKAKTDEKEGEEEEIRSVRVREFMSVQELANVLDVGSTDVITKCFELGIPVTINQRLEIDMITLIVEDYGYQVELVEESIDDLFSLGEDEEGAEAAVPRAPVVTIMGHVDHGKTSLLDYIRNTNVVAGESGGITQHIGAYKVVLDHDTNVTFLDTPGHEAFTAMRARGAQVTDVVILIVAANDGVKPQTIEAIDHAKAARVPIVVAINKIDRGDANPDAVKKGLADHGILVEEWGGKYQCVEISAKTGQGIDNLLELLALETEVLELKASIDTDAKGTVIESRLDKGHGAIATVLVQKGTLCVGDPFVCGNSFGKVRALMNERNARIESAGPSDPVQVLGLASPPQAGDRFAVIADEKLARKLATERDRFQREIARQRVKTKSLDKISEQIREGLMKTLPLIVKADVDGSIEALVEALANIPSKEVGVEIVHKGVGTISESDVLLASASEAIVVGFNVGVHSNAKLLAKNSGVEIRNYTVIYDATNEIKLALEGLLEPEIIETILGKAEIMQVFRISRLGFIAGCRIIEGTVSLNSPARIIRDGEIIHDGTVASLKHFQDDVNSIDEGKECGIGIEGARNFQEGDIIETYETEQVKRTLS